MTGQPIRPHVAVSACLLGQKVRYDGNDKYNVIIADSLSTYFELIPVCPEMNIGLGVPRAKIQLRDLNEIRLQVVDNPQIDLTEAITQHALDFINTHHLSGLVMQDRSPSCGILSTPVFDRHNQQTGFSSGLFSQTILKRHPNLPTIEACQVADNTQLQHFINRVQHYAHH